MRFPRPNKEMQTPPNPLLPPSLLLPLPSPARVPALGRDSRSQGGFISRDGTDKDFCHVEFEIDAFFSMRLRPASPLASLAWPLPPCSMPEPGVPVPLPSHYQRKPAGAARAPGGEAAGAEAQCCSGLKVILGER